MLSKGVVFRRENSEVGDCRVENSPVINTVMPRDPLRYAERHRACRAKEQLAAAQVSQGPIESQTHRPADSLTCSGLKLQSPYSITEKFRRRQDEKMKLTASPWDGLGKSETENS